jgi:hypothetical protein
LPECIDAAAIHIIANHIRSVREGHRDWQTNIPETTDSDITRDKQGGRSSKRRFGDGRARGSDRNAI